MHKQDHIDYWRKTADSDWIASEHLFEKKDYLQSLFFAHLVLEKLLKAHWVKDNTGDYPPRIHRLISLKDRIDLTLSEDEINILDDMEIFQMEGRYPDYHFRIAQLCTLQFTQILLERVKELKNSLISNLL
ncbi:MAG: HEPN domain-containing protein [Saprospiraceae bacterium]|nr:HEPN domain-containing protein [Saprospiraceae bacterium]